MLYIEFLVQAVEFFNNLESQMSVKIYGYISVLIYPDENGGFSVDKLLLNLISGQCLPLLGTLN